jgi:homoserine dehydrogenase
MGGEHPALEYIQEALRRGTHVVTANKEVMAKHGSKLLKLAASHGARLRFEASVGGGIPIIGPLQQDLLANEISSIRAIINGTTNYILTKMAREGIEFHTALAQAQQLGYAEPDPSNDLEGIDAAYKLAILASLAFHSRVPVSQVYCQGITHLQAKDFRYARELGYVIKLLAIGKKEQGAIQVRVHPVMLPQETPLAKVEGAFNAIEVQGDLVGSVVFSGLGAGAWPTTSAILGDVLDLARHQANQGPEDPHGGARQFLLDRDLVIKPMASLITRYYLRLNVLDRPGVLAQIAQVLGDQEISIASVIQKDADPSAGTAEIVITTHPAQEAAIQQASGRCQQLEIVKEGYNLIRIEAD